MKIDLFAFFRTAGSTAGRWFIATAIILLCVAGVRAAEPNFTNVTATVAPGLPQVGGSSVAWADFDGDGRLDFLLTGSSTITMSNADEGEYNVSIPVSQLWRNTGNGFSNVTATVAPGLSGVGARSVAWGDYDNDGRPDFLLGSQLWRNSGTGFSNVTATVAPGLPSGSGSSVAWGDYDNDGRLDFLITGSFVSQIWRNTGSNFVNVTATVAPGLPGVVVGSVAWGDYDNDGRLDFLLTGGIPRPHDQDDDTPLTPISQLWHNTETGFVNVTDTVTPGLPGVHWSSVAWADYDDDGRLDFLLTGWNRDAYRSMSQLWRNTENGFTNVTATVAPGLRGVHYSSVAWADYDQDGRVDFLLTGLNSITGRIVAQVWRNVGSGFTNVTASLAPGLPGVVYSSVSWGDYDNDGRPDFLLTGGLWEQCEVCDPPPTLSQIWRNNTAEIPPPPVITGLPEAVSQTSVTLNARINPLGVPTTAWFIWGDSTNYGHVTAAQPMGNGSSFIDVAQTITGLSTGVTYYYRAVGSNEQGQVILGVEQQFLLATPSVTTSSAGNLSPTSATLNGHAHPNNLLAYGWFEWGPTPAFGHVTPVQLLGGGFDASFSQNLSGLEVGATYYFRAVASNRLGLVYGAARSFVTPTFADVTVWAMSTVAMYDIRPGSVAWADFDNDGRLDFSLAGYLRDEENGRPVYIFQLWRNTESGFTNVTETLAHGLPKVVFSVGWADYDNDGWMDFLLAGDDGSHFVSQIWRNTGSGFTNVTATVAPGLRRVSGTIAWGDYDNDGRLDFFLSGYSEDEGTQVSQLWRNTASGFTNVTATAVPGLPAAYAGSAAWGDYDNDGRLDFLIAGNRNGNDYLATSQLWRNTGNGFTNVTATVAPGLPDVGLASIAWGDYDNDGRLDFLLTGYDTSSRGVSQIWRNTGSGFVNVTVVVAPGLPGAVAWGDYDNDGRLDLLITGTPNWYSGGRISQLWRNTGSGFTNVTATVVPGLPDTYLSSVAWGDYDNDGRLDFLFSGYSRGADENTVFTSRVWRNYTPLTNTPPSAPTGLAMTASSNAVMLSWNSATDDQTPASGLTYNVRAGTTPGGNDLLSAHVNATTGFRRVPAMGNAMLRHSLPLTGLTNGQTVYWSVHAVDSAFAGGPFAAETSVVSLPVLSVSLNSPPSTLNLSWTPPTFGWVLQQSPSLNASNWTMTASGSANPATLSATNAAQFYRLSKP